MKFEIFFSLRNKIRVGCYIYFAMDFREGSYC